MTGNAYSIDGRTFEFAAPLSGALPIGSYVQLDTRHGTFLGQLLDESVSAESTDRRSDVAGRGASRGTAYFWLNWVRMGRTLSMERPSSAKRRWSRLILRWSTPTSPRRRARERRSNSERSSGCPMCPPGCRLRGSGGIRFCAANPAPARPTRSGWCSNGSSSRPTSESA